MAIVTINRNNTYTATSVFQWDRNRELLIYGLNLDTAPEIHFSNTSMDCALVKQSTIDDTGIIRVNIPNIFLESDKLIKCWICVYNGEEFKSLYAFDLVVKARKRPTDYVAKDDEDKIYSYNELENLVNNTIINLENANEEFCESMINEVNALNEQTKNDVAHIIENTEIANADTVDGYHAENFVFNSKSGTTQFNADGSITTTYTDGTSEKTVFNADGSIVKTRITKDLGTVTETTTFNSDGSITIRVG